MSFFSCNALKRVSINNQECKVRPEIININSNEPWFYPWSVNIINKCNGTCNNINDPYAKSCVPDVIKNINVKGYSLISTANKTIYIKLHETCKCKCRLDASVCNNRQRLNEDKCIWECKNWLTKGCVINNLFGILVIVNVNVINHVILENT